MLEEYAHSIVVGTNWADFRNHELCVLPTCKQRDFQCGKVLICILNCHFYQITNLGGLIKSVY